MRKICRECGYVVPEICTPQQLMGDAAMADEIIEEVWRIKDEIARKHGSSTSSGNVMESEKRVWTVR